MHNRLAYSLVTLLAVVAWSSSYPVMRYLALVDSNPFLVAFCRAICTMIVFLLILLAMQTPPSLDNFKANWRILLGMGATGVAGMFLSLTVGLQYASASKCTLINSINPVLIVLLAHFVLKEQLNWQRILGVLLSLLGVLIVITGNDLEVWYNLSFEATDLFFVSAGMCWAVYSILNRYLGNKIGHIEGLFWVFACAVLLLLPVAIIYRGEFSHFTGLSYGWLLYLGLIPGAVGNFLWYKGIMVVGAATAGLINSFLPIFTIIIAYFTLGETLTPMQFVGTAILFFGVWLGISKATETR